MVCFCFRHTCVVGSEAESGTYHILLPTPGASYQTWHSQSVQGRVDGKGMHAFGPVSQLLTMGAMQAPCNPDRVRSRASQDPGFVLGTVRSSSEDWKGPLGRQGQRMIDSGPRSKPRKPGPSCEAGHSHVSRTEQRRPGLTVRTPGSPFQVPSLVALPVTKEAFPYGRSTKTEGGTSCRGDQAAASWKQLGDISSPDVPPARLRWGRDQALGLRGRVAWQEFQQKEPVTNKAWRWSSVCRGCRARSECEGVRRVEGKGFFRAATATSRWNPSPLRGIPAKGPPGFCLHHSGGREPTFS